jgi:hypothetical protein
VIAAHLVYIPDKPPKTIRFTEQAEYVLPAMHRLLSRKPISSNQHLILLKLLTIIANDVTVDSQIILSMIDDTFLQSSPLNQFWLLQATIALHESGQDVISMVPTLYKLLTGVNELTISGLPHQLYSYGLAHAAKLHKSEIAQYPWTNVSLIF